MVDRSQPDPNREESTSEDELRAISFRLRELQRLVGMRVRQENRRLEEEGLEPVTDHAFFKPEEEAESEE